MMEPNRGDADSQRAASIALVWEREGGDARLTMEGRAILCVMWLLASKDGTRWISEVTEDELRERTGLRSERAVKAALRQVRRRGFATLIRGTKSRYTLKLSKLRRKPLAPIAEKVDEKPQHDDELVRLRRLLGLNVSDEDERAGDNTDDELPDENEEGEP